MPVCRRRMWISNMKSVEVCVYIGVCISHYKDRTSVEGNTWQRKYLAEEIEFRYVLTNCVHSIAVNKVNAFDPIERNMHRSYGTSGRKRCNAEPYTRWHLVTLLRRPDNTMCAYADCWTSTSQFKFCHSNLGLWRRPNDRSKLRDYLTSTVYMC
jgi:hypothetical protein